MSYITRVRAIYHKHIRQRDIEARFLILGSFTLTFIFARITVYGIKYKFLPSLLFGNIQINQLHIHHLVFGIILLLIAGIIQIPEYKNSLIRFSSILYGIGAALTLDEFSLWLRLDPDAYFGPQGRISIDAVAIFILVLLSTVWYGKLWNTLFRYTYSYLLKKNPIKKQIIRNKMIKKILFTLILCSISFMMGITVTLGISDHVIKKQTNFPIRAITTKQIKLPTPIPVAACTANDDQELMSIPASTSFGKILKKTNVQAQDIKKLDEGGYCIHIPVLMYHHVQPQAESVKNNQTTLSVDNGIFMQQVEYLVSQKYTFITIDQIVSALQNHTGLPAKSIALTFDDGYEDNYQYVFPLLKQYHILANFEVPTGLLGIHADTNSYYTWDQLKEMANSGLVNVNPHTWSHYGLGIGAPDKNEYEIATPTQQIKQYLGISSIAFVYPYGSYKPWVFPILQKYGYQGAFSTEPQSGMMECDSYIMHLHRTRIGNFPLTTLGL